MRYLTCLPLLFLTAATLQAEDDLNEYEGLIVAAQLPDGYQMTRQDIKNGNKVAANVLIVTKQGAAAKSVTTIEQRELPTDGHRTAALKAYVNSTRDSFKNAGFGLTASELPDIKKIDLSKPVVVKLTFENSEQSTTFVEMRMFFTTIGYSTVIVSDTKEGLAELSKWAATIQEK